MPMVDGDWSVDRATGNIRYIGFDHSPTTTVSAGAFVTGDYYQIRSVGTTDFTLVGAADNNVGTRFEATGAGTGTGVATQAASYATVIQFHRWLQALADDPEFAGDDELDIIDKDPSSRSTDNIITLTNGFNVDATAIEHLYDGSVTQGSGNTEERWDGIVNFGNSDVHIQIIQAGAILTDDYWNYGWQAGSHTPVTSSTTVLTDSTASWTTDEWVGYTIINVTDGSRGIITSNTSTTITVDELYGGTDNDWDQSDVYNIAVPLNGDSGAGISHRFMIKVLENGVDIGRRRLLGTSRRYGNTYSEFPINGSTPGNNVLALSDSSDLNNTTAPSVIDAIADITNTEGLRLIDISGDGTDEEYYSEWDRGANSINTFYEYLKWRSADSNPSGANLQGESGELHRGVTHSAPYDTETGTPTTATNDKHVFGTFVSHGTVTGGPFTVGEVVRQDGGNWEGRVLGVDTVNTSLIVDIETGTVSTTEAFTGVSSGATATTDATPAGEEIQNAAGEAKVLAFDDDGATGNFYIQLTKGVAPLNNTRLYDATDHTDYYTLSANATERPVAKPFVGVSTGSALIGAYGLGLQAADTAAADTYFDLQNNPITPPNNVTFTVSGFISGDYVLVTEDNASDINFTQMALNATLSATNVTAVSVVSIPSDTPTTAGTKGSIRIERDDGLYSLHRYTSFDTGTNDFTIPSTDFSTNNATSGNNVFIGYLDYTASGTSDNFSYVYSSDRTHFVRVRDGGATPIKTAETTGVMSNTGGTASVNRIDDT